MKKAIKFCVRLVIGLVVLLFLVILLHPFIVGPAIKAGVEKIGPGMTRTSMTLAGAHVNLFRGVIELRGLKVGNPEGYQTEAAVKVGAVRIGIDPLSVFSDTIHVRHVFVDAAEAWYEMGVPSSNIGKLQKNIDTFVGAPKAKAETKPDKPGKKVVIDDLQILNTCVHVGVKGIGGGALPIPVPDIRQKDLGKEGDGKSIGQMTAEILASVLGGVTDAAAGAGKAVGDAGKAVGGAALDAGKSVGGAALDAGKAVGSGIKGIFGGK